MLAEPVDIAQHTIRELRGGFDYKNFEWHVKEAVRKLVVATSYSSPLSEGRHPQPVHDSPDRKDCRRRMPNHRQCLPSSRFHASTTDVVFFQHR